MKTWAAVVGVLAGLASGAAAEEGGRSSELIGRQVYTRSNIFHEGGIVKWANYLKGGIIPVGTKVLLKSYDDEEQWVVFEDVKDKTLYSLYCDTEKSGLSLDKQLRYFFTETDPAPAVAKLTASERENVEAAAIDVGMSKEAVIFAVGMPPAHETRSTQVNRWRYWMNRFKTRMVVFRDGKVHQIQD